MHHRAQQDFAVFFYKFPKWGGWDIPQAWSASTEALCNRGARANPPLSLQPGCSGCAQCDIVGQMKRIWLMSVIAAGWSQEPVRVAPLRFDVTSVKEVQPQNVSPRRITADPGRWRGDSVSIDNLVAYAYGVQPAQIVGMKPGMGLYDVEGKAEGAYSQPELRVMLQGLLTDRFRLKFHREERELPAELLVASNDLKLKMANLSEADPSGYKLSTSDRGPNFLTAKATAMSLGWLADNMSGHLSELVLDQTGLKGVYAFEVDFETDRSEAIDPRVPVHEAANRIRLDLLSALGLKLQSTKKAQVEVLVIDQVELPNAN